MGKYLLNSRGVECKWQPSDNTKPVAMIKKRLAGNQVLIAYLKKVKVFDKYTVKPALTAKTMGKVFKPSGGAVTLTKSGKSIQFLFEVVRRESDWQKKVVDKMKFYDNFVPLDSGFKSLPQLIIVCEDDRHMAEVFRELVTHNIEFSKINLYYTTDLKQNSKLDNRELKFQNKYKAQNVELKLLN